MDIKQGYIIEMIADCYIAKAMLNRRNKFFIFGKTPVWVLRWFVCYYYLYGMGDKYAEDYAYLNQKALEEIKMLKSYAKRHGLFWKTGKPL